MGGDWEDRLQHRVECFHDPCGRTTIRGMVVGGRRARGVRRRYSDNGGRVRSTAEDPTSGGRLASDRYIAVRQRLSERGLAGSSDDPRNPARYLLGSFGPKTGLVEDTWNTLGMRGTGSAHFGANDVFVPDYLTADPAPLTNPPPGMGGPLFRMWPWVSNLGQVTVAVASAASAVEAAVDHCEKKTPNYQQTVLQDQQLAQYFLGKAAALVEASRDTLYRAAQAAYDDVENSEKPLSREAKIRVQLATSFAAEACADATRCVNDVVGTSAIRQTQPFERYFRDTHTIIHHAQIPTVGMWTLRS